MEDWQKEQMRNLSDFMTDSFRLRHNDRLLGESWDIDPVKSDNDSDSDIASSKATILFLALGVLPLGSFFILGEWALLLSAVPMVGGIVSNFLARVSNLVSIEKLDIIGVMFLELYLPLLLISFSLSCMSENNPLPGLPAVLGFAWALWVFLDSIHGNEGYKSIKDEVKAEKRPFEIGDLVKKKDEIVFGHVLKISNSGRILVDWDWQKEPEIIWQHEFPEIHNLSKTYK